jgi:hypothetical protein
LALAAQRAESWRRNQYADVVALLGLPEARTAPS